MKEEIPNVSANIPNSEIPQRFILKQICVYKFARLLHVHLHNGVHASVSARFIPRLFPLINKTWELCMFFLQINLLQQYSCSLSNLQIDFRVF
jgi:hypothetical protein